MMKGKLRTTASVLALLALGACSTSNPNYQNYPTSASGTYPSGATTNVISGYGTVQSVELVPVQSGSGGTGVGSVAGAVVGGLVGHQFGSGSGQTAATIAGAAGGALAGHAIENRQAANTQQVYRVTLRMDDGSVQNLIQESAPTLRIGDRVRVVNGVVERL